MILQICCVRDRQADSFANPMFLLAIGQAIRSFSDEINNNKEGNPLFAHPDDFDLYSLGTFDTNSGAFNIFPVPSQIAVGKNLKLNGSVTNPS